MALSEKPCALDLAPESGEAADELDQELVLATCGLETIEESLADYMNTR
jgi:hypothetical protein